MYQQQAPDLKETNPHGTQSFPCAFYQTQMCGHGFMVKHHWHKEAEILYFPDGNFRMEINMEAFDIRSECFYFVNPGELHSIRSASREPLQEYAVVFQPELRRALEYVGRNKFVRGSMLNIGKEKAIKITDEFVTALQNLSSEKTGALIVIERQTALNDRVETGTIIDADISEQLIGNIFYEGAPLHDGAVIVRGDRLYAAGCVLPLTENKNLDKELGTRHRAGIGITEHSDAIAIIVSEETGVISMARDGVITRYLDTKTIEKTLLNLYIPQETDKPSWIKKLLGGKKNV